MRAKRSSYCLEGAVLSPYNRMSQATVHSQRMATGESKADRSFHQHRKRAQHACNKHSKPGYYYYPLPVGSIGTTATLGLSNVPVPGGVFKGKGNQPPGFLGPWGWVNLLVRGAVPCCSPRLGPACKVHTSDS
jgi:hypothetical protein